MMRKSWVASLGVVAALIAAAMILHDYRNVVDVLELADPTGSFGLYFHLGGLAANLAVILVAPCVLPRGSQSDFNLGFAVVAFVPSVLEAIAVLPCFLPARPGAFCGVGVVLVSYLAVPIVIAAAIAFIATSRRGTAKMAGLAAVAAFVGFVAAAQALLAPSGPDQCRKFDEVTKR